MWPCHRSTFLESSREQLTRFLHELSDGVWITLADSLHPREADALRVRLESHGITAFVWGEAHPATPLGVPGERHRHHGAPGGTRLHVHREQLWQAREVLTAFAGEHRRPGWATWLVTALVLLLAALAAAVLASR